MLSHTRVTAPNATPERWLLVLHGIYGSGRNWGSIARRLAEARPEWGILLVDLRLHGASRDGFEGPHTVAAAAADVDALVAELDFHAAAVLGHSFGGKVALVYARHHGEDVRQVWVIDSTLRVREPEGSARREARCRCPPRSPWSCAPTRARARRWRLSAKACARSIPAFPRTMKAR